MKKISTFIFAATIFASCFTSCKKDDFNGMQFKASMERIADKDGKTYFAYNSDGGGTFYWKSSDDFKVWDDNHTGRNYKIQLPEGASYTTFNDPDAGQYAETVELVTTSDAPGLSGDTFYAFYPGYKSGWDGDAGKHTVVLDRDQVLDNWDPDKYDASIHGTEDAYTAARLPMVHLKRFPMYAKTTNNTLRFKHLCGALMLKLQQNGKSIRSIKFTTTDQQVSGTFTINTSVNPTNNPLEVKTTGLTADEMTTNITFSKPVSIANSTMFWIRLPQGVYRNFSITIVDADYNEVSLSPTGGYLEIKRGCVTPVDFTGNMNYTAPEGLGVFTVAVDANKNATKKVYFSPGNLQFVDEHWKFADHQYDVLHPRSGQLYDPENAHAWDLFAWSTPHNEYGKNNNLVYNGPTPWFKDWGTVFGDNTWFTMSSNEFVCLIRDRQTGINITAGGQTFNSVRFLPVLLDNGMQGIIIFPDSWPSNADLSRISQITWPMQNSSSDSYLFNNMPPNSTWRNMQSLSMDDYQVLENAGCAFLPASGDTWGFPPVTMHIFDVEGNSVAVKYWTSTGQSSAQATIFTLDNSLQYQQNWMNGNIAYAVRLVRQAPLSK